MCENLSPIGKEMYPSIRFKHARAQRERERERESEREKTRVVCDAHHARIYNTSSSIKARLSNIAASLVFGRERGEHVSHVS